jgi:branched-chain amino acid transport system permease protein
MDTLQLVVSGLALGSIYALIALGVVIIVKASDLINFAHGELVMIGAIVAHTVRVVMGLPALVAFAGAVMVTGGVGMLIERVAYRPLRFSPPIIDLS